MPPEAAARPVAAAGPRAVRKYANRRLYDTATGRFVTLADLHELVRNGEDFVVREAKTDRDITASVLAQIVAEESAKGNDLLPLGYLRRLLHLYHAGLGDQLSAYLESSMETFAAGQREMFRSLSNPFDPAGPFAAFRELGERNAEFFARSFGMFERNRRDPVTAREGPAESEPRPEPEHEPIAEHEPEPGAGPEPAARPASPRSADAPADDLEALRAELLALQRRLDAIERRRSE